MNRLTRTSLGHSALLYTLALFAITTGSACDSSAELSPVVGNWSADTLEGSTPAARYEFRPDGTFSVEDNQQPTPLRASGTYSATDTLLTLDGMADNGNSYRLETTYYVGENNLYLWVFQPESDTQGMEGRWMGSMDLRISGRNEVGFRGDVTFELREDGSAGLNYQLFSAYDGSVDELSVNSEGTYHETLGATYYFSFDVAQEAGVADTSTLDFVLKLVDGAVLTSNGFTFALAAE